MNWGKGVAIVLGLFIVFIGFLAFTLIRQKVDLVTDEYYKEDMAYQGEIDALDAGFKLKELQVSQRNGQLIVEFDQNITSDSVIIDLWRPNDKKLDKSFSVKGTHLFMLPLQEIESGSYELRCQYWKDGKKSTQKTKIWIDKSTI